MSGNLTPRQMFEGLLRGILPPRPLFLPIVFSFGAQVESMPREKFLRDATKITSSLRQIQSHLPADGLTCYYDPYLECEAMGCSLEWGPEGRWPTPRWPRRGGGGLPESLRSPEDAVTNERIRVALEVIHRLRSLTREDCLLTAFLTGPLTLASRIADLDQDSHRTDVLAAALDIAASMTMLVSSAFAEAGADLIFICEDVLTATTTESGQAWASGLAPAFNIVRFYQRVPVLHLAGEPSLVSTLSAMLKDQSGFVLCVALDEFNFTNGISLHNQTTLGIAVPDEALCCDEAGEENLCRRLNYALSKTRVALVTTASDVQKAAEIKRLNTVRQVIDKR